MTLDANEALARRAIGYNHGAADDGTEIFAADFVAYTPGQPSLDMLGLLQQIGAIPA